MLVANKSFFFFFFFKLEGEQNKSPVLLLLNLVLTRQHVSLTFCLYCGVYKVLWCNLSSISTFKRWASFSLCLSVLFYIERKQKTSICGLEMLEKPSVLLQCITLYTSLSHFYCPLMLHVTPYVQAVSAGLVGAAGNHLTVLIFHQGNHWQVQECIFHSGACFKVAWSYFFFFFFLQ